MKRKIDLKRFLLLAAMLISITANSQNYFPSTGNVGIGTSSPSKPLTVTGTINTWKSFLTQGYDADLTGQGGYIMWNYSTITDCCAGETDFINNQGLAVPGGFRWYNTPRTGSPVNFLMSLTGDGNLGIGTKTPAYKLDVQNGIINVGTGANKYYKAQYLTMGNSDYNYFPYIGFNAILTTSDIPTAVNAFTPAWNQGSGLVIRGDPGLCGLHFLQRTYANGTPPYDLNSFTEVLTLTTSGTLGLGTTDTKGYKLAVNGSAVFTKAVVKLNSAWPDYVFSPSYKMPQLDSLEQFIRINGHLPEIPKAETIEKNGIDLGSNQALLLKKIEELTLIVIEQNERIEKLENKNN